MINAVITTINEPNEGMRKLAEYCALAGGNLVVVGDKKTKPGWEDPAFDFLSVDAQLNLDLKSVVTTPFNHYSRKNLGYLHAFISKNEWIYETDDDNIPTANPFAGRTLNVEVDVFNTTTKWLNIYEVFTASTKSNFSSWPRGFDLGSIKQSTIDSPNSTSVVSPIQQGLADGDPDVDAIYRLVMDAPVKFDVRKPVALQQNQWSPINSQTTWWHREFFRLMYLPSTCTFRLTDIVRGYVATRIIKAHGKSLTYHSPVVFQDRNEHNLLNDLRDEVLLYQHANYYIEQLEALPVESMKTISEQMISCYRVFMEHGAIQESEFTSLANWLSDCDKLGLK